MRNVVLYVLKHIPSIVIRISLIFYFNILYFIFFRSIQVFIYSNKNYVYLFFAFNILYDMMQDVTT